MSHLRDANGTVLCQHTGDHVEPDAHGHHGVGEGHHHDEHDQGPSHGHDHSHGLVDRSILRSRAGVKAVALSLLILGLTAGVQVVIFTFSNSVALLADVIHNFGDALTAVPLAIAFFLRSVRGEKIAGLTVVLAIFVSACVALYETVQRVIIHSISRTLECSLRRV